MLSVCVAKLLRSEAALFVALANVTPSERRGEFADAEQ